MRLWFVLLFVFGVAVVYPCHATYLTAQNIQERLARELDKRDPNYVKCASILSQPILNSDRTQVAFFGEEKLRQQLDIIKSLACQGLYLPKKVFKRAAAQGMPEEIVPRWKYNVLLPAAYYQHSDLCRKHPRLGRLPASERWETLRQAITWPEQSWYCLLNTYILDRIRQDVQVFTQLGRTVFSCRDGCQVCNAICSLSHTKSGTPQSRHRLACIIRYMTMNGDIGPHRYKCLVSPSMIAYRGDTAEDMMHREEHDVSIYQRRAEQYKQCDVVNRHLFHALYEYARNTMTPMCIIKTFTTVRDMIGNESLLCTHNEFITKVMRAYRHRTSDDKVADLLYQTAGMKKWDQLVASAVNVCPRAVITPVYKQVTPLHYIAVNDRGGDMLPHVYLCMRYYDDCPLLFHNQLDKQMWAGKIISRSASCSLFEAAANVRNIDAMRNVYQLYAMQKSGLADYFPPELVHEIYTYTAQ